MFPNTALEAKLKDGAAPVWIAIGMVPGRKADGSLQMAEEEELMAVACAFQNLHLMAQALGLARIWHSKGPSVHLAVARFGFGRVRPLAVLFRCGWLVSEW